MALIGYAPFYAPDGTNSFNIPVYEITVAFTKPGSQTGNWGTLTTTGIDFYVNGKYILDNAFFAYPSSSVSSATKSNSFTNKDLGIYPEASYLDGVVSHVHAKRISFKGGNLFAPVIGASWLTSFSCYAIILKLTGNGGVYVPFTINEENAIYWNVNDYDGFSEWPTDIEIVQNSRPIPSTSPEIPNMTRDRAFLLGNLLRQGLVARREPVAYLYNGVRLPKLPSVSGYDFKILWDRRNAPLSNVTLYLCATPPTTVDGDGNITVNQNGDGCIKYKFNINYSTDWSDGVVLNDIDILPGFAGNGELLNTKWLWSNCNIYDADGNVVHAATDPIPVYE